MSDYDDFGSDFESDFGSDFESPSESESASQSSESAPSPSPAAPTHRVMIDRSVNVTTEQSDACQQTVPLMPTDAAVQAPAPLSTVPAPLEEFLTRVTGPTEALLEENMYLTELESMRANVSQLMLPDSPFDWVTIGLNRAPVEALDPATQPALAGMEGLTIDALEFNADIQYVLYAICSIPRPTTPPPALAASVAVSPDVLTPRLSFIVKWTIPGPTAEVLAHPVGLTSMAYHPGRQTLVAGTEWGGLALFGPEAAPVHESPHTGAVRAVCVAPDMGRDVVLTVCRARAALWVLTDTGATMVRTVDTDTFALGAVAPLGEGAVIATDGAKIVRYDRVASAVDASDEPVYAPLRGLMVTALRPTPGKGLVASLDSGVSVFTSDSTRPVFTFTAVGEEKMGPGVERNDAVLSPWHRGVAFLLDGGQIRLVDIPAPGAEGRGLTIYPARPGDLPATALALSNGDGSRPDTAVPRLAVSVADGRVLMYKLILPTRGVGAELKEW